MLGMNVDTFAIEKMFLDLDPNFKKLRDLKEEYIEFNEQDYVDEFDVLSSLNMLIDKYRRSDQSIFRDFALFLRANTDPIVNSFIKVKVHRKSASGEKEYYARLSNGPMESFNRSLSIENRKTSKENQEDSPISIIHETASCGLHVRTPA